MCRVLTVCMLARTLEEIGLTASESKAYLALLRLGSATSGAILQDAKLNSGKIYEILESLKHKGLVAESMENGIRHFAPARPEQLLSFIAAKKKALAKQEELVTTVLPQLAALRGKRVASTKALTFTGIKGFKAAVAEATANTPDGAEVLAMGIVQNKSAFFNRFWEHWNQQKAERNIRTRYIYSEGGSHYDIVKRHEQTQVRLLESITPATVDIFGEEAVIIFNFEEPVSCILIYDRNIALAFRAFFDQLWLIAKE